MVAFLFLHQKPTSDDWRKWVSSHPWVAILLTDEWIGKNACRRLDFISPLSEMHVL